MTSYSLHGWHCKPSTECTCLHARRWGPQMERHMKRQIETRNFLIWLQGQVKRVKKEVRSEALVGQDLLLAQLPGSFGGCSCARPTVGWSTSHAMHVPSFHEASWGPFWGRHLRRVVCPLSQVSGGCRTQKETNIFYIYTFLCSNYLDKSCCVAFRVGWLFQKNFGRS